MIDVISYWKQGRKTKQTPSGWISGNAPCCIHNGQTGDKRSRGGIKSTEQGWSYSCFNCNYTASFILGRTLSYKARRLLGWMGVPDAEIDALNLESLRHRSIHGILDDRQRMFNTLADIRFDEQELPPLSELLTGEDLRREYIRLRCVPDDYPVMIQDHPEKSWRHRPSVIIPFTYDDRIVGHTQRFLDDRTPKYISNSQPGYVFGTDLQHADWTHVIVVEGIFDALCISGLAVMHSTISDEQARLIRSLGREIIVVPDQDLPGIELIDRAVELGYSVSIPGWPDHIKDVNDAVIEYGRFGTLLTIMQAKEKSKIKIEIAKRNLVKKIGST